MDPITLSTDSSSTSDQKEDVLTVTQIEKSTNESSPDTHEQEANQESSKNKYIPLSVAATTFLFFPLIFVYLIFGIINYRHSGNLFFRGIGYFFLSLLILAVVGFGLCFMP